jgi:hypothetical protein
MGSTVDVFKLRSTILHQITAYTLLLTVTTVVLWSCRHHPLHLRSILHWSVACTRQQRFHVCRHVLALLLLSAFIHLRRRWFLVYFDVSGLGEAFMCWCVDYTRHHSRFPSLTIHCVVIFCSFLCFCCFLLLSHTVMGVFLFLFCVLGYSIVGRFPTTRLNWCASSRSCPLIHRYLEVFRSDVFQLRSTNFRRPLHLTLHSIGFSVLSPSTQHQPLHCPALSSERAAHAPDLVAVHADYHCYLSYGPMLCDYFMFFVFSFL